MTNEMIRARMWEAYKAGACREGAPNKEEAIKRIRYMREDFDKWLADPEHFPELVGDGEDGELNPAPYPDSNWKE